MFQYLHYHRKRTFFLKQKRILFRTKEIIIRPEIIRVSINYSSNLQSSTMISSIISLIFLKERSILFNFKLLGKERSFQPLSF